MSGKFIVSPKRYKIGFVAQSSKVLFRFHNKQQTAEVSKSMDRTAFMVLQLLAAAFPLDGRLAVQKSYGLCLDSRNETHVALNT